VPTWRFEVAVDEVVGPGVPPVVVLVVTLGMLDGEEAPLPYMVPLVDLVTLENELVVSVNVDVSVTVVVPGDRVVLGDVIVGIRVGRSVKSIEAALGSTDEAPPTTREQIATMSLFLGDNALVRFRSWGRDDV
jgi:hypothetical protein